MLTFAYLKRLGLHGSRLLWRVFMIPAPVIGYSFWRAFKEMLVAEQDVPKDDDEPPFGYLDSYGTPEYSNVTDAQWGAYYGDRN